MAKNTFINKGIENNYTILEEKPVLRENEDTFFIGSSVMANMKLFNSEKKKHHETSSKYITAQPVFSANRLEDVGNYPLASSFEVMLSIFRFGDDTVIPGTKFIIDFLSEYLDIEMNDLIYLAPHELSIKESILELGINEENIISWENNIPLKLDKNNNQGYYLKIFIPYKHGIIPIATLGFLKENEQIAVDSALFFERLDFVKNNLNHWYEGEFFEVLVKEVKQQIPDLNENEVYMWTNHLRTIIFLYDQGVRPNTKGSGHTMRKLIRSLSGTTSNQHIDYNSAHELVKAGQICLFNLGYVLKTDLDVLNNDIFGLINKGAYQIKIELEKFENAIKKQQDISEENILRWKDEKGLQFEWMKKVADNYNDFIIPFPKKDKKFWLRNECYSFNEEDIIYEPIEFLKNAEKKRLKEKK